MITFPFPLLNFPSAGNSSATPSVTLAPVSGLSNVPSGESRGVERSQRSAAGVLCDSGEASDMAIRRLERNGTWGGQVVLGRDGMG